MVAAPRSLRGLIHKAGRLVLVKSVMSARAVHHLLILEAPVWLFKELAKGLRASFWAGKDTVNGGQCLVAWDRICMPIIFGGLGVKDLWRQGLALRWEWFGRCDPNRQCKDCRGIIMTVMLPRFSGVSQRSEWGTEGRSCFGGTAGLMVSVLLILPPLVYAQVRDRKSVV